jgi:TonB family protein
VVAAAPVARPEIPVEPRREVAPQPAAPAAPATPGPPVAAAPPAPPLRAPASAAPAAADDSGDIKKFALAINTRVGQVVKERGEDRIYPRLAKQRGWEGVTTISVEYSQGKIKRVWAADSGGHIVLDQRAVDLVQEVAPSVPIPANLKRRSQFVVTLTVAFKLKDKR